MQWTEYITDAAPPPKRYLDFDIETRKVGFISGGQWGPDGCEPIAIAASWIGEDEVHCWALGEHTAETLLNEFRRLYDRADVVTGHYIRKFDLPILNGAMLEHGMQPLEPKMTHDTKQDLVKRAGISASQENLSQMLGLADEKYHMSDADWRDAARLTPEAIINTKKRCTDDVIQHKALYRKLSELGALKPAKVWRP